MSTSVGDLTKIAKTIEPISSSSSQQEELAAARCNTTIGLSCMNVDIYKAATEGNTVTLAEHRHLLHQILTPTKSTVLHIYIANASRPWIIKSHEKARESVNTVKKILGMCPQPLVLQPNGNGEMALHIAARHGNGAIVELLIKAAKALHHGDLEKGENEAWKMMRTTNNEGDTALHEAVRFKHLGAVKILTKQDPEFVYSANAAGETPLFLAVERGHHDVLTEILSTCQHPSYEGPNGRTALHAAVIYNDEGKSSIRSPSTIR